MANSIALFKSYIPLLDEVYKLGGLTSALDGALDIERQNMYAHEIVIPKMDMSGLGNYDRNTGYPSGEVTTTYETVTCEYDRGKMFQVDTLDDAETAGIAFGRLAGEFIRTKVTPELDAWRIAQYASAPGVTSARGPLLDGAEVIAALRACANAMDNGEVSLEDRVLFITPGPIGLVEDMDTTASRAVIARFGVVARVPQSRMNTAVTLGANGFTLTGEPINFLAAHRGAVIQYQKHISPKIVPPEANQNADAWKFGYRSVGIARVYENRKAGIYVNIYEDPPEPEPPAQGGGSGED
ncbi:MAG: hypothetical protein LBS11_11190 [Oscillospiraceae bacterium]|jgi:hypothetical protein|nr:hypothetical protein [Oscillospiraceae bacterium]